MTPRTASCGFDPRNEASFNGRNVKSLAARASSRRRKPRFMGISAKWRLVPRLLGLGRINEPSCLWVGALEQAPKKLIDFFDKSLLQHFDFGRFLIIRTITFERKAL